MLDILKVLIGSVFGSGVALLAVVLTMRHEAKEKKKEREMALRREVYLGVVEAISSASVVLIKSFLADPQEACEILERLEASLGKIYIVGGDETVKAALETEDRLAKAFAALRPKEFTFAQSGTRAKPVGSPDELRQHLRRIHDAMISTEIAIKEELDIKFDSKEYRKMRTTYIEIAEAN